MFRARRPAKACQNTVIKPAFDRQIARQWPPRGDVTPGPLDMSDNRCQTRRRGIPLADLNRGTREGALHDVRASLR
jgi:hypothetical protein